MIVDDVVDDVAVVVVHDGVNAFVAAVVVTDGVAVIVNDYVAVLTVRRHF